MPSFRPLKGIRIVSTLILLVVVLATGAGSFAAPAVQQSGGGLFTDAVGEAALSLSEMPAVEFARVVSVDFQMLENTTVGDTLALNLFPDVVLESVITNIEPTENGSTKIGYLDGIAMSQVVLVEGGGQMAANISMPGAIYQVRYAGGDVHAIYHINQSAYPPEMEPKLVPASAGESSQPTEGIQTPVELEATTADDGSLIDVMVVYTPLAASRAGGTTAIKNEIDLAVTETNQSYANSGITQRINLVHTAEVSYNEAGSIDTDLNRLTYDDGYMDNVHDLRDTYKADIVSLIAERSDYCGVAWLMDNVSSYFEAYAFNVVARTCATGYYSLGHEMGHNMGSGHDWYVDDSEYSPYSYNKGYVNTQAHWRTIMSYNRKCTDSNPPFNCLRLPYWSNPDVFYEGNPTGVQIGTSTSCRAGDLENPECDADNRRVLNNTAYTVANFRVAGSSGTVGPVEYNGYDIDDNNTGDSSGNNNGQAECGETIELSVDLRNQGISAAESVNAAVSTSDPNVTFPQNTSSGYGDIPSGATRTNSNDFEIRLANNTPHGRSISFSLGISASNGGPWSDSFNLTVACPSYPDISLSSNTLNTVQAVDQVVVESIEIGNTGNANLEWGITEGSVTGESCSAENFPWVSVSPTSGTIQPGNSRTVDVSFDSIGLAPGTYSGELCVSSNDPNENPLSVTLSMFAASSFNYLPFITR
ncbi:M12 family metallo-peptidase [Chloroflexota bacterium]